jgi:sugar phosphate isomerase/epimerase
LIKSPIALQLYSVREDLARDFEGTLDKIKRMGYTAVETGQFAGEPHMQAEKFKESGLEVVAAHVKPPVSEDKENSLDFLKILGCNRLVVPWLDPKMYFRSADGVLRAADLLNQAARNTWEESLSFYYHNHDFEFENLDGEPAFNLLLEKLDPRIQFEIDTYWVETAGANIVDLLDRLEGRASLLHIKDGPLQREEPMVALGDGKMDIEKLLAARDSHVEWLIVELDRCAGDMMEAVGRSLTYLSGL